MEPLPDLGSLTDDDLKKLIGQLEQEEQDVSYRRRLLHGKIDILRAELVNRLRKSNESGELVISGADVQQLTDNITIDGEFNWWSDSEVIRDFRPQDFFKIQTPDNFIESVYTGEDVIGSVFARYQANYYNAVQERLPELRFDLPSTPLLLGIDQRVYSSIVSLDDREPLTPDIRSVRFDAFYGLSRNFAITPYLDVTPVVGARITHYSDTGGAPLSGSVNYGYVVGEQRADGAIVFKEYDYSTNAVQKTFAVKADGTATP